MLCECIHFIFALQSDQVGHSKYCALATTHHSWLVIVLTGGQRRQPRPLPRRVEQSRRDLPPVQLPGKVHPVLLPRGAARLLVGVERPQAVPGAAGGGPVFAHGEDHGVTARGRAPRGAYTLREAVHPVLGLIVVRRADDRHVEDLRGGGVGHGLHGGLNHWVVIAEQWDKMVRGGLKGWLGTLCGPASGG